MKRAIGIFGVVGVGVMAVTTVAQPHGSDAWQSGLSRGVGENVLGDVKILARTG